MLRYQVDDLSCGHCASAVTAAVKALDPAAEVAVDLDRKQVEVRSTQTSAAVGAAISKAGYTPMPYEGTAPAKGGGCCCGSRR